MYMICCCLTFQIEHITLMLNIYSRRSFRCPCNYDGSSTLLSHQTFCTYMVAIDAHFIWLQCNSTCCIYIHTGPCSVIELQVAAGTIAVNFSTFNCVLNGPELHLGAWEGTLCLLLSLVPLARKDAFISYPTSVTHSHNRAPLFFKLVTLAAFSAMS